MTVEIQQISQEAHIPIQQQFELWAQLLLNKTNEAVLIRIVDKAESQQLNHQYRHKNAPTNVLSFPDTLPFEINPFIGDLIICAPIITEQAIAQNKPIEAHWAHMVIHGMLHLHGYDHINAEDATIMEQIEINLLKQLGIPNPYATYYL